MKPLEKVAQKIWLIDLEPPLKGLKRIFGSYVVEGEKIALVESSFPNVAETLVSKLEKAGIPPEKVSYVLGTHIHLDHAGGFGHLSELLPNAHFLIHPRGLPHLANPEKLWKASIQALGPLAYEYGEPKPVPRERLHPLQDGETISLGEGLRLRVVETLGHASHHMSFLEEASRTLFTGDSCGIRFEKYGVIRPVTPPGVSLPELVDSILKMEGLNVKTLAFTHFGAYENPSDAFHQFRQALHLWLDLTLKAYKAGRGVEDLYSQVKALDRPLEPILKERTEVFIRQSVEGLLDYVRRKGVEGAEAALEKLKISLGKR